MHPEDAHQFELISGDWVEVTSRRGSVTCRVMVTGRSPLGTVFLPFHFVEAAANLLTLDKIDPRAKIPDYKMAAVKLRKTDALQRDGSQIPLEERGAIKIRRNLSIKGRWHGRSIPSPFAQKITGQAKTPC